MQKMCMSMTVPTRFANGLAAKLGFLHVSCNPQLLYDTRTFPFWLFCYYFQSPRYMVASFSILLHTAMVRYSKYAYV